MSKLQQHVAIDVILDQAAIGCAVVVVDAVAADVAIDHADSNCFVGQRIDLKWDIEIDLEVSTKASRAYDDRGRIETKCSDIYLLPLE